MYRKIIFVLALVLCAITPPRILLAQTVTVVPDEVIAAVPKHFPPHFQIDEDGNPEGFAIEVMDVIAERADLNITYKVYDNWTGVQNAVKRGEAQIVPNMGETADRSLFFNFATPLERIQTSFFVQREEAGELTAPNLLGRVISTTYTNAARTILEQRGGYHLNLHDVSAEAIDAVLQGHADAVALPESVVFNYLLEIKSPNALVPVGRPITQISRSVAVHKNYIELFRQINSVSKVFVNSDEYRFLYRKWHRGSETTWDIITATYFVLGLLIAIIASIWMWLHLAPTYSKQDIDEKLRSTSETEAHFRKRIMALAGVLFISVFLSAFSVLYLHYEITLQQMKQDMQDALANHVALIEGMSTLLDPNITQDIRDRRRELIVSGIKSAQTRYAGIGEFTVAEQVGDEIVFISRQHHWDRFSPARIPFSSNLAEPMRRALNGNKGSVIDVDYQSIEVLAVYQFIDTLDLGIVLKKDITDIQAPYIQMGIYGAIVSFIIAMIGAIVYARVTDPMIRDILLYEARYDGFRDNVEALMFINDLDGNTVEISQAYADLFGLKREELLKDMVKRNLPTDVIERLRKQDQQIIETRKPLSSEEVFEIEGERYEFLQKKFPIFAADGDVYAVGGIAVDITGERETERALIKSEERFRATFEQAAVGLAHVGLDGSWLRINKVLCEITGYSRRELLSKTFQEITHPDDLDKDLEHVQDLLDGKISTYSMEKRYFRKDGTITWIYLTGSLVRDEDGNPDYFIAVIEDINERVAIRQGAQKERDRFRRFLDLAGTMVIALDQNGKITLVNKEACFVLGYTPSELMGRDWFQVALPLAIRGEVREVATKILKGDVDEVAYYENEVLTKTGEHRLIGWNNTYLHNEDGKIDTILSAGIDITDTRKNMEALKRTNRALKTISRCNEVLVHTNNEQELLREICRVVVEEGGFGLAWTGFIREDHGNGYVSTAHYGVGYEAVDDCLEGLNTKHNPQTISKPTIYTDIQEELCPSKCTACNQYGLTSLCLLPLMKEGDPFGALFIASNENTSFDDAQVKVLTELANDLSYGITSLRTERDRTRIVEELRVSEERSSAIINNAHDAIISVDRQGRITQFNPSAETMFGYTSDDVIGINMSDTIVPERYRKAHNAGFQRFIESGKSDLFGSSLELVGKKIDDTEFPIELTLSPMTGDTDDICTAVIRDVSDRHDAEHHRRQAQNMESLGNMAGGMAHDINNMLLPILNLTAMVRRDLEEDSRAHRKLLMVEQAAERVKDLVENILVFSRQDTPHMEDVHVVAVLHEALGLIRPTTPKTITIHEDIENIPDRISVDKGQFTAALMNLFSNSSDALGVHVGKIEMSLKKIRPTQKEIKRNADLSAIDYARITINDNGKGMEQPVLERALDPFFTTKPPGKGTGLGMSMIHGIMMKHGGAIDIESEPGFGTSVSLYFPLLKSTNQTSSTSALKGDHV